LVLAAVLLVALGGCSASAPDAAPPAPATVDPALPSPRGHPPPPATTSSPSTPSGSPVEPSPTPEPPAFASAVGPITAALAERMTPSSWREGCPVPLADLRYVTVSHWTFEGTVATGELVVHEDVADHVTAVFAAIFEAEYPIRSLRLVDDFGGDDDASMAADNSSAFNSRAVTGGTAWSEHAYGRALDLNPVENPYVLDDLVLPPAGRAFLDRPDAPGVIHPDDAVVRAFAAVGWEWGGSWERPVDFQHFSLTGR
jgi:poly-gamma-glutamate synthesis protein (capsule biosynthesis protein)